MGINFPISKRQLPITTYRRIKTPTILQMEEVECGAAALGIVLAYYERYVPLEALRVACGVSRDGAKASNMAQAAQAYGLIAKGYRQLAKRVRLLKPPFVVFWNSNHFLVVEGFHRNRVFVNDPATGPRVISAREFDQSYSGIVLVFQPSAEFQRGGEEPNTIVTLRKWISGSERILMWLVLLGVALVATGLVVPFFAKIFVDQFLIAGASDWITPLLIGMLVTAFARAALTAAQQHVLLQFETKLALKSARAFFWRVLRLPVEFFAQRDGGEIGARVEINEHIAEFLSTRLAATLVHLALMFFYAALMFYFDAGLTLLSIALALVNLAALQQVARARADGNLRLLQERGKLVGISMEGLRAIETIKATASEGAYLARWSDAQARALKAEKELGVTIQILAAVPPLLASLNTIAILSVGALRVMETHGAFTIGALVAFQSLTMNFIAPVNQLVGLAGELPELDGNIRRLEDVMRYPIEGKNFQLPTSNFQIGAEIKNWTLNGCIEIRNLTFGYSRREPPLIENFSLLIKPGARIALVGESGSGKTTIAKLLAGVYEPWSGEILFDGKSRRDVSQTRLSRALAMVDQDVSLFEGTVRQNLTLWDKNIPIASIERASRDACIAGDIAARTDGLDSIVEEDARNWSGGQRQRLEIARALVLDPAILILDEATSALDEPTERQVYENLKRRGCACLMIAQRLSAIFDCDEIIVLEKGKVVQRGRHAELMAVDGPYRRLVESEEAMLPEWVEMRDVPRVNLVAV